MNFPLTFADPLTIGLVTAGLGALGGVGTAAASIFGPKPKAPSMPAPAPPVQSPVGNQGTNAAGPNPSFLAAAAAPQTGQTGSKSLLGQ